MTFVLVGSISVGPLDEKILVGTVDVPAQGLEVRVVQISSSPFQTLSHGLLYVKTAAGRDLGTIKVWGHPEGEDYRLGEGRSTSIGIAELWFEPRLYNLKWLRAGAPVSWALKFYAQPATVTSPTESGGGGAFGTSWLGAFSTGNGAVLASTVRNGLVNLVLT